MSANDSSKPSGTAKQSADVESSSASGYIEAYAGYVKDELEAQDARKASFEQRGLTVITTSGTLVTLLFALAALSTGRSRTFVLPHTARMWLLVGLALFFFSAVAALLANAPFIYQAVEADKIRARLTAKPRDATWATKDIALTRTEALESAKRRNGVKGWALTAAMACEALAVGAVAIAIATVI